MAVDPDVPAGPPANVAPVTIPMPAQVSANTQGSPPALLGIGSPAGGNPGAATMASIPAAAATRDGQGHPVSSHGKAGPLSGGIPLGNGYNPTGGGAPLSSPQGGSQPGGHENAAMTTSSNTLVFATTVSAPATSAGTSVDAISSPASPTGNSTNHGGTFSFPGTGNSGGGGGSGGSGGSGGGGGQGGAPAIKGVVGIMEQSQSTHIIGGPAVFTAWASGGGVTITNVNWTVTGNNKMYIGQHIADPSSGPVPVPFQNTPYTLTHNATISFWWGEIPSMETIKADITVKDDQTGKTTMLTATVTIPVCSPGIDGDVDDAKAVGVARSKTNPNDVVLAYFNPKTGQGGINWATLAPTKKTVGGSFSIVQLLESSTLTVTGKTEQLTGNYNVNKNTNPPTYTPAPGFPLDDVAAGSTSPFYAGTQDAPLTWLAVSSTTVFKDTFTDYVMYKPPSGIWVPEATFAWKIDATAVVSDKGVLSYEGNTAGLTQKVTVGHTWPPGWKDVTGKYSGLQAGQGAIGVPFEVD